MTEKEKRSLKIRLGKRLSYDKSRIMEIVKEEIDKTETTIERPLQIGPSVNSQLAFDRGYKKGYEDAKIKYIEKFEKHIRNLLAQEEEAIVQAISSLKRPKVTYICKDKGTDYCHHTSYVSMARNFEKVGDNAYQEMERQNEP